MYITLFHIYTILYTYSEVIYIHEKKPCKFVCKLCFFLWLQNLLLSKIFSRKMRSAGALTLQLVYSIRSLPQHNTMLYNSGEIHENIFQYIYIYKCSYINDYYMQSV